MNEDVYKMIDTLHARLNDVREAVDSLNCEATGYANKLDKIDDKLYLLQCEIEKLGTSTSTQEGADAVSDDGLKEDVQQETQTAQTKQVAQTESEGTELLEEGSATDSSDIGGEEAGQAKKADSAEDELSTDGENKKKEIFSDDMKENLADAGRAIGNIYRDGKEVITELSGTMGDLKDIFSFVKKR